MPAGESFNCKNQRSQVPNHAVHSRFSRGATAVRRLENFSARRLATWISIVIIYIVRFLFSHRFTFYILHFYSNERVKFFPRAYGTLS